MSSNSPSTTTTTAATTPSFSNNNEKLRSSSSSQSHSHSHGMISPSPHVSDILLSMAKDGRYLSYFVDLFMDALLPWLTTTSTSATTTTTTASHNEQRQITRMRNIKNLLHRKFRPELELICSLLLYKFVYMEFGSTIGMEHVGIKVVPFSSSSTHHHSNYSNNNRYMSSCSSINIVTVFRALCYLLPPYFIRKLALCSPSQQQQQSSPPSSIFTDGWKELYSMLFEDQSQLDINDTNNNNSSENLENLRGSARQQAFLQQRQRMLERFQSLEQQNGDEGAEGNSSNTDNNVSPEDPVPTTDTHNETQNNNDNLNTGIFTSPSFVRRMYNTGKPILESFFIALSKIHMTENSLHAHISNTSNFDTNHHQSDNNGDTETDTLVTQHQQQTTTQPPSTYSDILDTMIHNENNNTDNDSGNAITSNNSLLYRIASSVQFWKWILRLNLAFFYINGKHPTFFSPLGRFLGHRLVITNRTNNNTNNNINHRGNHTANQGTVGDIPVGRPSYQTLGILICIQAISEFVQFGSKTIIDLYIRWRTHYHQKKIKLQQHTLLNESQKQQLIQKKVPSINTQNNNNRKEEPMRTQGFNVSTSNNNNCIGCSICMKKQCDFPPALLPCGHVFCWSCVQHWCTHVRSECPFCRKPCKPQQIICLWQKNF